MNNHKSECEQSKSEAGGTLNIPSQQCERLFVNVNNHNKVNIPCQKCERLLVLEQILQAHLVVHDGLQAFDAPGANKSQFFSS